MRIFDSSQRDAEAGLWNIVYHILLVASSRFEFQKLTILHLAVGLILPLIMYKILHVIILGAKSRHGVWSRSICANVLRPAWTTRRGDSNFVRASRFITAATARGNLGNERITDNSC